MNAQDQLVQRLFLIKNAITSEKEINRIPFLANIWSWKYLDAGYKLSEALNDYEKMEKSIRHLVETYKMDVPYERGFRNPVQPVSVLGEDEYIIDDEKGSISIKDQLFMQENEYDALIENPIKYIWEILIPRKHTALRQEKNSAEFGRFLGEYGKFGAFLGKMDGMLLEEYGFPAFSDFACPIGVVDSGVEVLVSGFRGIKGSSIDMRRHPEKMEQAIRAYDAIFVDAKYQAAQKTIGTSPIAAFDEHSTMIAQTIMTVPQFERFYLPHLKKVNKYITEFDKLSYIFMEGENKRFFDILRDLPENHYAYCSECNDIKEVKELLPNVSVVGGLDIFTLGNGTPEQCIDLAKELIETVGYDKRYIMCESKMVSFPGDLRSENYKAVTEYVADFRF